MTSLLRNATPWLAEAIPFVDDSGCEGRLLVVKIQYRIEAAGLTLLEDTEPLSHEDKFDDASIAGVAQDLAPLLQPADVRDPQPATNVLLTGHAYAPRSEAEAGVKHFEAWLGVGSVVFPMRIHGPRRWRSRWLLSRLLTLFLRRRFKRAQDGRVTRVPLAWQHAYGGVDAFRGDGPVELWPMNPAGRGFHADPRKFTVKELPLPAIEDPRQLIDRWQDRRVPQLPGAVNPRWSPRVGLGGTQDAHWSNTRAPAMPSDGSARFHNTAHPGLQFTPHLVGGEPVRAQGFTANGEALAFYLPLNRLSLNSYHYGGFLEHPLPLNTVQIDADQRRLTLIYRSFVPARHQGNELRRLALGSAEFPARLEP